MKNLVSRKIAVMTTDPRPRTQVSDPTGRQVAANVRRIREARQWSTYDLARRLAEVGRPIAASAIAKVERAERRVDVGDLTALAAVLRVSPSALLLPLSDAPQTTTQVTGGGEVASDTAWDWVDGHRPLHIVGTDVGTALLEYELYGRPPHRRGQGRRTAGPTYIEDVNRYIREQGFEPELGEDGMVTWRRSEETGD